MSDDNVSAPGSKRSRKRGLVVDWRVVAERMQTLGIYSQQELAYRVAELEGRDEGMRSTISNMKRGKPMDMSTIVKVSAALDLTPADIIASPEAGEKKQFAEPEAAIESVTVRRSSLLWLMVAGVAVVLALAVLTLRNSSLNSDASSIPSQASPSAHSRPLPSIGLFAPKGPESETYIRALREHLGRHWPLPAEPDYLQGERLPVAVDQGIWLSTRDEGRYHVVKVGLKDNDTRQVLYAHALPASSSQRRRAMEMSRAAQAIHSYFSDTPYPASPSDAALIRYLEALQSFDRSRSELTVRRIESNLLQVLRDVPDWNPALAGMCNVYVQQNILSNDPLLLQPASDYCLRALAAPGAEAFLANAVLSRRNGDLDTAQTHLQQALDLAPYHIGALTAAAYLHSELARRSGDEQHLQRAAALADQAISIEPTYWKGRFTRGYVAYMMQDQDEAIRQFEAVNALTPNLQAYSNLVALHICRGAFDAAGLTARRAMDAGFRDPVMMHNYGVSLLHSGHTDDAAAHLKQALDEQEAAGGAPHDFWGSYADALGSAGNRAQALEAYTRALDLIEREQLERQGNPVHESTRLYYEAALSRLRSEDGNISLATQAEWKRRLAALTPLPTDAETSVRVASLYAILGDTAKARDIIAAADSTCPGYLVAPELKAL